VGIVKLDHVGAEGSHVTSQGEGGKGREVPPKRDRQGGETLLAGTILQGSSRVTHDRHIVAGVRHTPRREQDLILATAPRAGAVDVKHSQVVVDCVSSRSFANLRKL
jgi:hypothetical protein